MSSLRVRRPAAIDWGDPKGSRYCIAQIVALTQVPPSSIHYYLRQGLVPEPEHVAPNRFLYDDRHVLALGIIRSLRRRGRTLGEIRRAVTDLWSGDQDVDAAIARYLDQQTELRGPRARLIDAAIASFAHKGYEDVSVAILCTRAGVAKGTFYRYFENKDALLLAAATSVVERAVVAFGSEVAAGTAPDYALSFARHVRNGLPILLELAKRSIQDSGSAVGAAAVPLFIDLVERLGRVVRVVDDDAGDAGDAGDADDAGAVAEVGAMIVMLAIVEIFDQLVEAETAKGGLVADS